MKRLQGYLPIVALSILSSATADVLAQQTTNQPAPAVRPQQPPLTVQKVKGDIYQVKGGAGANAGFVVGEEEVFVIDAKMTDESARQMLQEIAKISPLPVKKVLLTHSDGDHVNGLTGFPPTVDVISHENTSTHVAGAFRADNQRRYVPNVSFTENLRISRGTDSASGRIEMLYFGPAHTDGDVIVHFPAEKVAFAGDLIFLGRDPLIHRTKNGTSFGLMKVLKSILALDVDLILSGHNDPITKDSIRTFITSVEERQEKVAAMVKSGKSLEEVKAAFQIDTQPAGQGARRWPSLVEVIYLELTQKK